MSKVVSKVRSVLRLRDEFLALLVEAQKKRSELTVDEWILHERTVLFKAVNRERSKAGHPPIDIAAVERIERMASGHSDYSRKFALYCVELAYGIYPEP